MLLDDILKHADEIFERVQHLDYELPLRIFPGADKTYQRLLKIGGIHAFSRALRIFGLTKNSNAKNIIWWNEPRVWKLKCRGFFLDAWSFAEDVFGNQFMFNKDAVVWLQLETGELQYICGSFKEWLSVINTDINFYTGASIARAWDKTHTNEKITGMYHLCPLKLFVCGGSYTIDNMFRYSVFEHMSLKAKIAQQIRNSPDGAQIELSFES